MQHVVVIIKPHAVQHRLALVQQFKNAGFRVVGERVVDINVDEAWFICKHENGLTNIVDSQTEHKVHSFLGIAVVLLLNHKNAFNVLEDIAGVDDPIQARNVQPRSLRALFGDQGSFNAISFAGISKRNILSYVQYIVINTPYIFIIIFVIIIMMLEFRMSSFFFKAHLLTGTLDKSTTFIQHFFPHYSDLLNGPADNIAEERVSIDQYFRTRMLPTLLDAFYDMCIVKPAEPVSYLADYLLNHNPNRPKILKPFDTRDRRGRSNFTSTADYREKTKGQSVDTTTEDGFSAREAGQSEEVSTTDFEREMRRSGYTNTSISQEEKAPGRSAYASTGDFQRSRLRSDQTSITGKGEGPAAFTMTEDVQT